jgi:hypothetical protein
MTDFPPPNLDPADAPALTHGIRADSVHWVDCWNFGLAGTRSATEMVASVEGTPSLRDAPLEVLRERPDEWPPTFLSAFGMLVLQGAMVRAGLRLGTGAPPRETRWHSDADTAVVLRRADRELQLEQARQIAAPHAASRLSCLWAAQDTEAGRNWVHRMLGHNSFVVPVVVITAIRMSRCDARWLDQLEARGDEAAAGYWTGKPHGEVPLWEFLIDGTISATDPDDTARIRAWARENVPSDLRWTPPQG